MTRELNDLFRKLMGRPDVSLYPFQEKVAHSLLSSPSNVILRAPTGAGKTWATLLPFLWAREKGDRLVDRVLYALPLRSLASQLYTSTVKGCQQAGFRVRTIYDAVGTAQADDVESLVVTLQTGEQQDDPFFQGDIVFTTIDQLLSSYILDPVSLPGRLANINVGAILGSLVVIDEFHLLEPDKSMGTAIEMLDRLRPYCRFVLMTATLSDAAVLWLRNRLDAEVIELKNDEIGLIEGRKQKPTLRKWIWSDEGLSAQAVLADHRQRSLVILNTVGRAQEIYRELLERKRPETNVCLLHSRFFRDDRLRWENEALSKLGKENQSAEEDFILVSTQVVEAGMDFSVDVLHTEAAPVNSLIQRAGRCARYGGEGLVKVYPVPNEAPYDRTVLQQTAGFLRVRSGDVFFFRDEMNAVNSVHSEAEMNHLSEYDSLRNRRSLVNEAMDGLRKGARENLIRDVNSVSILVTDEPEKVHFGLSEWPELLSVPYGTLLGFLNKAEVDPGDWIIGIPVEADEDSDDSRIIQFRWQRTASTKTGLPWLVAINPRYAAYSPREGLLLGQSGKAAEIRYRSRRSREGYRYRCEIYSDHINRVLDHLDKALSNSVNAQRLIAKNSVLPEELIIKAARIAAALHDVGKLSVAWQNAARVWQEHKTPGMVPEEPIAHTDYDPKTDWDKWRRFKDPPAHAVEGAYAVCDYLISLFEDVPELGLCVITAIARHHSGHARALKTFSLVPEAVPTVGELLAQLGLPRPQTLRDKPDNLTCGPKGEFARDLLSATRVEDAEWLPVYWFVVRCLRLADQLGTAEGGRQ